MDSFTSRIIWTSEDERTLFPYTCSLRAMIFKRAYSNLALESDLELLARWNGSPCTVQIVLRTLLVEGSSTNFLSLNVFNGYMTTLTKFEECLKTPLRMIGGLPPIAHFASWLSATNGPD